MGINLSKWQNVLLFVIVFPTISELVVQNYSDWWEYIIPKDYYALKPILTFVAVYAALITSYNLLLWKIPLFHWIRVREFPNLNGTWKGNFENKNRKTKGHVKLIIKQTATKIYIEGLFSKSSSISFGEAFRKDKIGNSYLHYFFTNKPNNKSVDTMNMHEGACFLKYDCKKKELNGEYFSGNGRNECGFLKVKK